MLPTTIYGKKELYCLDSDVLQTLERESMEGKDSKNLLYLLNYFSTDVEHPFLRLEPMKGLSCAYMMQRAVNSNLIDKDLAKRVHRQFQKHGVYACIQDGGKAENIFQSSDGRSIEINKMVIDFESDNFDSFVKQDGLLNLDLKSLQAFKEYVYGRRDMEYLATDWHITTAKSLYFFGHEAANDNLKASCMQVFLAYAKTPTPTKNLNVFRQLKQAYPANPDIDKATTLALESYAKGAGISCKATDTHNHLRPDFFLGLQSLPVIKEDNDFSALIKDFYPGICIEKGCSLDAAMMAFFLDPQHRALFKKLLIANDSPELLKTIANHFPNIIEVNADHAYFSYLSKEAKGCFNNASR
jgi:hypothetical protein